MKTAFSCVGLVFLTILLLAGCEPPAGESDIIAGEWSGTWTETYLGIGDFDVSVSLSRNGDILTGTAVAALQNYTVSGTISGSTVAGLLMLDSDPTYQITVIGTVSGDTMSGTWEDNDAPQWGGTFSMTR